MCDREFALARALAFGLGEPNFREIVVQRGPANV